MKHICIYTTLETFEHKKNFDGHMYWSFKNAPKLYQDYEEQFEDGKDDDEVFGKGRKPKLYFAYNGMIRGYFIVNDWTEHINWFEMNFESDSWTDIKPIPTKSHQGFKYVND